MTSTQEILQRVAAGELTPDEALPLLDAAGSESPTSEAPAPEAPTVEPPATEARSAEAPTPGSSTSETPTAPPWGSPQTESPASPQGPSPTDERLTPTVTAVRVNASYRSVDIVADPTVAQVAVTGNHTVRRENGVLVVESQDTPFSSGGPFARGPGEQGGRSQGSFTFADLPRSLAWAKSWKDQRLVVRVNPELPVELDAAGATVKISGFTAGVRVRAVASAVKLERVRGPIDIDALSSSVKGVAVPTSRSRIACESSSVKLLLGEGSDVHIRARNRMGKVVLPNAVSKGGLVDPDVSEATIGRGTADLVVEAVMSSVMLTDDAGADWASTDWIG